MWMTCHCRCRRVPRDWKFHSADPWIRSTPCDSRRHCKWSPRRRRPRPSQHCWRTLEYERERLNWLIGELESEFISRQSFAGREEDYFIKARFNGKSASSLTESRTHNNGNGFVLVWLTDWAVKCGLAKS